MRSPAVHVLAVAAALAAYAGPAVPEAAAQNAPGPEQGWRTEAQLGAEYDHVSNGHDPWRRLVVEVGQRKARRAWYIGASETERFSRLDRAMSVGLSVPLGARATVQAEADGSMTHHVVPRWSAAGRLDVAAGRGWVLHGGFRYREYQSAEVYLSQAGIERYAGPWRLAYTAYLGHLAGGGSSASHVARVDFLYGASQQNLLGIGAAAGTELENLGAPGVVRTDVRSVSLVGRQWLGPHWAVVFSAAIHDQGAHYTRGGGTLGVRVRF